MSSLSATKPFLLRIDGDQCMDDASATTSGSKSMHLYPCSGSSNNQQFVYDAGLKQLKNPVKNLCVDDAGGAAGTALTLATCAPSSANQQFVYDAARGTFANPNRANAVIQGSLGVNTLAPYSATAETQVFRPDYSWPAASLQLNTVRSATADVQFVNTAPDPAQYRILASPSLPVTFQRKVKSIRIAAKYTAAGTVLHLTRLRLLTWKGADLLTAATVDAAASRLSTPFDTANSAPVSNLWVDDTSMAHTGSAAQPYMIVTLKTAVEVARVLITQRTDCCTDRIVGGTLEAYDEDGVLMKSKLLTADVNQDMFLSTSPVSSASATQAQAVTAPGSGLVKNNALLLLPGAPTTYYQLQRLDGYWVNAGLPILASALAPKPVVSAVLGSVTVTWPFTYAGAAYTLQLMDEAGAPPINTPVTPVNSGPFSVTVAGLKRNMVYAAAVLVTENGVTASFSAGLFKLPALITAVALATPTAVYLNLTVPVGVTGFKSKLVYASVAAGSVPKEVLLGDSAAEGVVKGLLPGTQYTITLMTQQLDSSWVAESTLQVTTVGSQFAVAKVGTTFVQLGWAPIDADLVVSAKNSVTGTALQARPAAGSTGTRMTGLDPNTLYNFTLSIDTSAAGTAGTAAAPLGAAAYGTAAAAAASACSMLPLLALLALLLALLLKH